jgi:hypothetical protein
MAREGGPQPIGGCRRYIKRGEEAGMVDWLQAGALMRRDRLHRRAISCIHGENGVVYAGECGGPLNGLFDTRLRTKVHPLAAAFFNGANLILEAKHGTLLPANMYALMAYSSTQGKSRPTRLQTFLAAEDLREDGREPSTSDARERYGDMQRWSQQGHALRGIGTFDPVLDHPPR